MPLAQFLLGACEGRHDFFGIPTLDWDRLHMAQEPVQRSVLVNRAVNEKADEALHARPDQECIDKRYMVAHQQRRTTHGHVLLPDYTDAIQRVREQPQAEADEKR